MSFSTYQKLFFSHFLVLLLFVFSAGSYFYYSTKQGMMESLQSRLSHSAALLSRSFDVKELEMIRNKESMETAVYQKNIERIRHFADSNQDIAFVYIMRRDHDAAVFVIDSDTKQAAIPGEKYEVWLPELMQGFTELSADKNINHDKWGSFLSGYAPIYQAHGMYLIGLDMRADEVVKRMDKLQQMALWSLLVCVLLAIGFSMVLARHFTRRLKQLTKQCAAVTEVGSFNVTVPKQGDELDTLSATVQQMTERMRARQQLSTRDTSSLQKAKDALKKIVQECTKELEVTNEKLAQEIEERKKVEDELERSAYADYLTGLLNRRAMMRILEHEGQRTYREKETFCLIFIDVDHFKKINDEYGHAIGDQVLVTLTQQLGLLMRNNDVLARWGGEEFLLLLPSTSLKEAMVMAEELRMTLATYLFSCEDIKLHVTASFGVSEHSDMASLDDSIRMADAAMYHAKNKGRNCVMSFVENRKNKHRQSQLPDGQRRKPI